MDQFRYDQYHQNANAASNYNKVYINRNFNRMESKGTPTVSSCNVMYFNRNFSNTASSQHNNVPHRDQAIRPRIHVNPNFIKSKPEDCFSVNSSEINTGLSISRPTRTCLQLACTQQTQAIIEHHKNIATVSNSRYCLVRQKEKLTCTQQTQAVTEHYKNMATVSNSRYCLVRQKENKITRTPLVKTLPNNSQQTVKVNKYKSISINTVKKNLATEKKTSSKIREATLNQSIILKSKSKYRTSSKPILNQVQNTRFKYTKRNSLATSDIKQETLKRVSITPNKSVKASYRQTKKIIKGAMKKNNIPCRLFKKYGKCLRMIRGNCDYLHDKKHVSICRKFLKGICHDKQCLLSHDLTDKKMPTCYFYLQGICTKVGCPYLHVKLNEKTKICLDFLKGYCEKGDKCLHRHVNISPANVTKVTKALKKNYPTNIATKIFRKNTASNKDNTTPVTVIDNPRIQEAAKDKRYFRDLADDQTSGNKCDVIKPTRCKLGALPSFIQL